MINNNGKIYDCAITGLPVQEIDEFTNVNFGNGYFVSLLKIGDHIIYSQNAGNMKFSDISRYYQLVESFIEKANVRLPYIEIRDLKKLKGRAPTEQNRIQKLYIVKHKKDFAGFIVCNMPIWFRIMLKAALKLNSTPIKFILCNDYNDAIREAFNIIQNKKIKAENFLAFTDIHFKSAWNIENDHNKVIHGVIPKKLFYTSLHGSFQQNDIRIVTDVMDSIFLEGRLAGEKYIRISDYSNLTKASVKTRNLFAKAVLDLNHKHNSNIKASYICGAGKLVKTSMLLYSAFMNLEFIFVDTVDEAFSLINGEKINREKRTKSIKVSQKDIDEIVTLSGSLIWYEHSKIKSLVSPNNPLRQLSETLSIVQEDLIELKEKDIEQTRDLQKSLTMMKRLSQELKISHDETQQLNEELLASNEQLFEQKEEVEAAQDRLVHMNANLETLVKERTAILGKTVQQLNKTVTELDRFVYSASHDLSAPLKSILGLVNIARIDTDKNNTTEYLQYIENSIHNLEEVIKNLISYSRNTRMKIKRDPFNLYELIQDTIRELTFIPSGTSIKYVVNVPDNEVIVADRQRLKVILHNLINNSIKYADHSKSQPFVEIGFNREDSGYTIYVKDNGLGIEKNHLKKIFTMFYRATEKSHGSGLGLFIVDETVATLNGTIKVNSIPNLETVFSISLPNTDQIETNAL